MELAQRIQAMRRKLGISQEELAARTGVSRQAVSKWETGQAVPEVDKLVLLSQALGTTTDYLLKGEQPAGQPRQWDARLFALAAAVVNGIGLLAAVTIWLEVRRVYSVGVGLGVMAVGIALFAAGQLLETRQQPAARRLFWLLNVWLLSLIPASCLFNAGCALLGGWFPELAPLPLRSNSLAAYLGFWAVYLTACTAVDLHILRKA